MKSKRIILGLAMAFVVCSSLTVFAASVSKRYDYGSGKDVTVYGYVKFLEGPLTIQDKVYYTVSMSGTNVGKCTVAYSVIVDNKEKFHGVLNKSNLSDSGNGLAVGYGHEYAKLVLDFNGKTKTITSYAD